MDVSFSWRKTQPGDLAKCLQLHPAKNGAEIVGLARAIKAWKQLLEMSHATRSAVVEMRDKDRNETLDCRVRQTTLLLNVGRWPSDPEFVYRGLRLVAESFDSEQR